MNCRYSAAVTTAAVCQVVLGIPGSCTGTASIAGPPRRDSRSVAAAADTRSYVLRLIVAFTPVFPRVGFGLVTPRVCARDRTGVTERPW
jgi:hypothetical protein